MNNSILINKRKLGKKRRKCEHVVQRETGIICNDTPRKVLRKTIPFIVIILIFVF